MCFDRGVCIRGGQPCQSDAINDDRRNLQRSCMVEEQHSTGPGGKLPCGVAAVAEVHSTTGFDRKTSGLNTGISLLLDGSVGIQQCGSCCGDAPFQQDIAGE